jgi:hypothetical protein
MFRVQTELPCGAISVGMETTDETQAIKWVASYVRQLKAMTGLVADVLLSEDGIEIHREHVHAS